MANNIVYANDGSYGEFREGEVGALMQGQTGVVATFTLKDLEGNTINLSGYTVTGKLKNRNTAVVASITGATAVTGSGEFSWTTHADDVAEDGPYWLWFTFVKASNPTYISHPTPLDIADDESVNGTFVAAGGVTVAMAEWLEDMVALNDADGNFIVGTGTAWAAESGVVARTSMGILVPIVVRQIATESAALTTGTAKITFRMPVAMTLVAVRASVITAPTGSTLIVDINEEGVSILSTKLSIDAGEKTSVTAATPAVISDTALADDAEMTVDIDQIGSTVAGAGLKVTLLGYQA